MSEDAIGSIYVDGVEYEIDWPSTLDDPSEKEDHAIIYRDGEQVGEFVNPSWEPFEDEGQVLDLATQFVEEGGCDDRP